MPGDDRQTTWLSGELGELISAGPLAHLTTINSDGSPQVSVIWIGLDGEEVVSGHMGRNLKVRNIERDPRVALSFVAPHEPDVFLNPYAVLRASARVTSGGAWDLLNRLAKVYMGPDQEFPAPKGDGGFVIRYTVERVAGVGPWATR
jgi:PPOX class probable F420-dependent enzyme